MTTLEIVLISCISVYYISGVAAYFRSGIKEDIEKGEVEKVGWIICIRGNLLISIPWPILLFITWIQDK